MDLLQRNWGNTTEEGPGVWVWMDSSRIELWPSPGTATAGTLRIEYPIIGTFTTSTSTCDLPAWVSNSAVDYVCYRAYLRDGPNNSLPRALRRKKSFEQSLTLVKRIKDSHLPSRQLTIKPGGRYEADILLARRRTGDPVPIPTPSSSTTTLTYDEIPTGSINGSNNTFTLTHTPSPTESLKLFNTGVLLQQGTHYTLSGTTITFVTAFIPASGEWLFASYKYSA